jgi:hypothetical protein
MSDDELNPWMLDEDVQARLLDLRKRVNPRDIPLLTLLLLTDIHDLLWVQTYGEDDEDEVDAPWR